MYSETFYKIGGALQFLAIIVFIIATLFAYGTYPPNTWNGLALMYLIFLINSSFLNLLIARSGMPLGQYQSFMLINIATWGLAFLVSVFYLPTLCILIHALVLLAFIAAFFTKPKFQ